MVLDSHITLNKMVAGRKAAAPESVPLWWLLAAMEHWLLRDLFARNSFMLARSVAWSWVYPLHQVEFSVK